MLDPVVLEGPLVRLEPLTLDHLDALLPVAVEPELWRYTWSKVSGSAELKAYIEAALAEQAAGTSLPFAIIERSSGTPIGSTRYGNIAMDHKRLEIGWTWLGRAWQRTGCNSECKLLLLGHAFETLGCRRVEFKTHHLNVKSRAALLRIGAAEEGIFRKHGIGWDGSNRDTVYFSIIDDEWPAVKAALSSPRR